MSTSRTAARGWRAESGSSRARIAARASTAASSVPEPSSSPPASARSKRCRRLSSHSCTPSDRLGASRRSAIPSGMGPQKEKNVSRPVSCTEPLPPASTATGGAKSFSRRTYSTAFHSQSDSSAPWRRGREGERGATQACARRGEGMGGGGAAEGRRACGGAYRHCAAVGLLPRSRPSTCELGC